MAGERNVDKIGNEVYFIAQTMLQFGISLDEAISELKLAYVERLEEEARRARESKS